MYSSRSSVLALRRENSRPTGFSGTFGRVITKSGPTNTFSSAAFSRPTALSNRGTCSTTNR